jgi:hypothetical protein
LERISREDGLLGGLALLLAIDLLFFPWFQASASIGPVSVSVSFSGTGSPDGWLGVLAMLAAVAVLADLAVERFSPQTQLPAIGGSRTMTRLALAGAAAAFMALKFLFHIHFSLFAWGFYLAVILVAGLVFVAMRDHQGNPVLTTPSGGSTGVASG